MADDRIDRRAQLRDVLHHLNCAHQRVTDDYVDALATVLDRIDDAIVSVQEARRG